MVMAHGKPIAKQGVVVQDPALIKARREVAIMEVMVWVTLGMTVGVPAIAKCLLAVSGEYLLFITIVCGWNLQAGLRPMRWCG